MAYETRTKATEVSVADFIAAVENPRRRADAETLCALFEEISGERSKMWGPSASLAQMRELYPEG